MISWIDNRVQAELETLAKPLGRPQLAIHSVRAYLIVTDMRLTSSPGA